MSIFALADTHLSFSSDKPMDIFGSAWDNHAERLSEMWKKTVSENDTVIIPGDISWAIDLKTAYSDFKFLDELPGKKIIGKGNHDYWWTTLKKMNSFFLENELSTINFLYNNAYLCEDKIICGTRGWINEFGIKDEDERLIKREAERLKISLTNGKKLKEQNPECEIIVFLHYPPVFGEFLNCDILDVLYTFDVKKVYYGHLHGVKKKQLDDSYLGISLFLVAGDYVGFCPQRIL